MNRSKIHERHLERQAFVYIRQSSMRQVKEHLESQDLQYQLLKRAQEFGWAAHQVTLLDDDLGKSGTSSQERMGFQNLVAAVGLRQVGIVLVTDVSRLARNCADWYQLLDLASMCDTLISDASGIYDPQHYNDRLLLGLKGTFSEVQWYQMREQLHAALLNKAKRGELVIRLPVGYEWLEDGRVAKVADQEVQRLIELVFAQFERLGTGRAVLNYLRTHKLQIPRAIHTGVDKGRIRWALPTSSAIYQFLKHPAYAGAYTYGKTRHVRLPGGGRQTKLERKPLKSWSVVLKKAFPAYIAWEQYMQNQEKLRQNAQTVFQSTGAPRQGAALLQGVVLCARCGRRMRAVYNRSPAYVCRSAHNQYGEPRCQYFTAPPIDAAVSELFLQAIAPARLEAALAAVDEIESQRQRLAEQWQLRLERARYQAQLAQRRYEQVDPDNRLVAGTLEQDWEAQLQALASLEQDWQQAQIELGTPLSASETAQVRALADDLPALWQAETTTPAERKRLLRCLIQDVTLDAFTDPEFSQVFIRWHTGAVSHLQVPRPQPGRRVNRDLLDQVRTLAQTLSDQQIAERLNLEGSTTYTGLVWTRLRVMGLRRKNNIPSNFHRSSYGPAPRGDGLYSVKQVAEFLQLSPTVIHDWFQKGFLVGRQARPKAHVWLRYDPDDRLRTGGAIPFDPQHMVPYPQAAEHFQLSPEQLRQALLSRSLVALRVLIFNRPRWIIQSAAIPYT